MERELSTTPANASLPDPQAKTAGLPVHLALVIVQIAFASQAVEGKIAMLPRVSGGEEIAPASIAMARMLGGTAFFMALYFGRKERPKLTRRDHVQLALLAILGITLNQTLFLIGLKMTSAMGASLLSVTIPVSTAAVAVLAKKERPSLRLALGLGIAVCGVLWLTGVHDFDRGALLVAANSLSYAIYLVFSRDIVRKLGALTVVAWIFLWGAIELSPVGLPSLLHDLPHFTARGAVLVFYIILMPTIVAYFCNAWALGKSSASLVTVYIYFQPAIAAVLAYVQLGQQISPRLAVAAVLILIGVGIAATRKVQPVVTRA
ncbi:MAG TPA: DMT family transporter [Polyangiaceae bacterium]